MDLRFRIFDMIIVLMIFFFKKSTECNVIDEGCGTSCITHLIVLILLSPDRNRKATDISGSEVVVELSFSISHQPVCFCELLQEY